MKLYEINYRNIPGPGDYRPGDENDPRSPDYDSRARKPYRGERPSAAEIAADHEVDQRREDQTNRSREAAHQAKISDVQETQSYPRGKQFAPVITRTGVALDRQTAQKEIGRLQYVAYETYETKIEELGDGKVKFMIKFMM